MLRPVVGFPAPVLDGDSAVEVTDYAGPHPLHHAECQGQPVLLSASLLDRPSCSAWLTSMPFILVESMGNVDH